MYPQQSSTNARRIDNSQNGNQTVVCAATVYLKKIRNVTVKVKVLLHNGVEGVLLARALGGNINQTGIIGTGKWIFGNVFVCNCLF